MIPYKDIGDNLTVNEFNGVISLLRENIELKKKIKELERKLGNNE